MATIDIPKPSTVSAGATGRFSWITENLGSHLREYGPTFATEFAVMASQIVTYKLAAHFLGKQGFSEYAVARRAISTIYPVALLGLGVALPRYIASCSHSDQEGLSDRFFDAAFCCVGLVALTFLGLLNLLPSRIAYLVYGSGVYASLVFPMSVVIGGLALHALCYAYFRGRLQMARANVLQFLNLAVVPVLAFFVRDHNPRTVLLGIGWLTVCVSVVALAGTPWPGLGGSCLAEAKTLLRYGVPRVPGDFAQMALMGLPTFFVAHSAGVQQAGFVALGISMISMIGAIFTPVGSILLPKSSSMFARGSIGELRKHVVVLVKLTVAMSLVLSVTVFSVPTILIRVLLGPQYEEVAQIIRLVIFGAVPYSIFLVLRNVLDALHDRAVTSFFLILSLFVMVLGAAIGLSLHLPAALSVISFLTALLLLGALAAFETRKMFRLLVSV